MATPATFRRCNVSPNPATSRSSRGVRIEPSAATRSVTSKRRSSGTSGGGRCWDSAYSAGRFWRPIARMSRNPLVVMRAQRAPRCSRSAFVAVVVPCAMAAASPAPSNRTPSFTARLWSSGVVAVLRMTGAPPFRHTKSVNVPPVSIPMRSVMPDNCEADRTYGGCRYGSRARRIVPGPGPPRKYPV